MLMQLELAELEPDLSANSQKWLKELESSSQRAAGLTRQLLLFSRQQAMEPRTLNLNGELDGVCKMLRRLLGDNIELELKKAEAPMWIRADPGMIEQIVMNLCINARDAMSQGGRIVVEVRSEQRVEHAGANSAHTGQFVCLAVTDTGCGMDLTLQKRIFEPFFTTKPVGMGTGLGLATVYGIAEQHHGWIEVDSAPNQGSTFRVYFPLCQPASSLAGSTAPGLVRGGNETILVVEDEDGLRVAITERLEHAGYHVSTAKTGVEALQKWDEKHAAFDLLLTDLVMPGGIDGLQLAGQLIRAKQELKVITMTGYHTGLGTESLPGTVIRLMKPFTGEALLECVRGRLDEK
jgi:two-component system cell cycle sensor histidine kinase/response regulator CckA